MEKSNKENKIFIGFVGNPINQTEIRNIISGGFECWDLKKIKFDDFILIIKKEIKPGNETISERNYKIDDPKETIGITEKIYNHSSWGLLIPFDIEGYDTNGYVESLFLINLYSDKFLYPLFSVSDFGIRNEQCPPYKILGYVDQDRSDIFQNQKFIDFFNKMLSVSIYGWSYYRDLYVKWNKEDCRLFLASQLFSGLKKYDINGRNSFFWPQEVVDMTIILESLFIAGEGDRNELKYKLEKRTSSFLKQILNNLENDISELYKKRSKFVHGEHFKDIVDKSGEGDPPLPDFEFLNKHRKNIRFLLVSYLYLHKIMIDKEEGEFIKYKNVLQVIEKSIIDIKLRSITHKYVRKITSLIY